MKTKEPTKINFGYKPNQNRGYQPTNANNGYRPNKTYSMAPPNQGSSVQSAPSKTEKD